MTAREDTLSPPEVARRGLVGAVAYVALLGALLAIAFVLDAREELAKGRFVDWVDHDVLRVEVLDRFTIYTDETLQPFSSDLATTFVLLLISGMALLAFGIALTVAADRPRLHLFFLLSALGTILLAFDEQMELSETFSYNVEALYVSDIFLYAPAAALFMFFFRRILMASRRALVAFAAGTMLFLLVQEFDRLPDDRLEGAEEKIEVVAAVVLGAGFLRLAIDLLAPPAAVARARSAGSTPR